MKVSTIVLVYLNWNLTCFTFTVSLLFFFYYVGECAFSQNCRIIYCQNALLWSCIFWCFTLCVLPSSFQRYSCNIYIGFIIIEKRSILEWENIFWKNLVEKDFFSWVVFCCFWISLFIKGMFKVTFKLKHLKCFLCLPELNWISFCSSGGLSLLFLASWQ